MTTIAALIAHRELPRFMASKQQRTMQRNRIHTHLSFASLPWQCSTHSNGKIPNGKDTGTVCTQNNNGKACREMLATADVQDLFSTLFEHCLLFPQTEQAYLYILASDVAIQDDHNPRFEITALEKNQTEPDDSPPQILRLPRNTAPIT